MSSAKRALIYNDPVAIFLTGHPQYIFWTNVLSVEKRRACTCFLSNLIILLFNLLYFFQLNVKGLNLNINYWNLTLGRTRIPPPWYKGEWGMDPPLNFWYVAVFRNDFAFSGKPLVFCTRWGIFYGWWCCWRSVTSPNMVAILAAFLDFIKNKNNELNRITNHQQSPPPPLYVRGLSLKVLKFWLFMICFTFLCSFKSKFQLFFKLVDLVEKNFCVKIICFHFHFPVDSNLLKLFISSWYLFLWCLWCNISNCLTYTKISFTFCNIDITCSIIYHQWFVRMMVASSCQEMY